VPLHHQDLLLMLTFVFAGIPGKGFRDEVSKNNSTGESLQSDNPVDWVSSNLAGL
jgi:hypothetical protein